MSSNSESETEVDNVEEMEDLDEKIKSIRIQLAPAVDYDLYVELLRLLRKNGDLDELNEERLKFLSTFTMSSDLWLEWIEDQKATDGSVEAMTSLFARSFEDFNYSDVWTEYVCWASGQSIELARETYEAAVAALGLRADKGAEFWCSYLDFEEQLLSQAVDENREKQRELVESLYRRALGIPNVDLIGTWERYQQFAGNNIDPSIKKAVEIAQKTLCDLGKFEVSLAEAEDALDVFSEYLEWELEGDDPARIQSMYERIVEKHPLDENVWLQYGKWMEKNLKIHQSTRRVYERAVRNCQYSCVLYQETLLALERAHADPDTIDKMWQKAKSSIADADDGRNLYRSYLYLLRRRAEADITMGEETIAKSDYSQMTTIYAEGQDLLRDTFGITWDPQHQYRRNYAWFAFTKYGDYKLGHRIWEDILASGGGRLAERWIEAVRNERQFGSTEQARKLLYRALNSVSDHPYVVYEAIIQFEREEGSIEQLDKALEKVNAQAIHRASRPQKKEDNSKHESGYRTKQEDKISEVSKNRKRPMNEDVKDVPSKKKALNESRTSTPSKQDSPFQKDKDGFAMPGLPMKKIEIPKVSGPVMPPSSAHEGQGKDIKEGDKKFTVFISNLDFKCSEDSIKEALAPGVLEVRLLYRGMSKLHKGYGYVDMDSEENYQSALKKDRVQIGGRPMYVNTYNVTDRTKNAAFKYSTGLEKNKLFVKQVHYDATNEQLKEVFEQFGEVIDARIVTHKSGKSKGVAYVDMCSDDAAKKALEAEDIILLERKLSVFLSNPPKKSDPSLPSDMAALNTTERKGHLQLVPRMARPGPNKTTTSKPSNGTVKMSNDQFKALFSGGKTQ